MTRLVPACLAALLALGCQGAPAPPPASPGCEVFAAADQPAGTLEVRVRKADGTPAAGVQVILSRNYTGATCPSSTMADTGADGVARVTALIPGNYGVNVGDAPPATADVKAGETATVDVTAP